MSSLGVTFAAVQWPAYAWRSGSLSGWINPGTVACVVGRKNGHAMRGTFYAATLWFSLRKSCENCSN